MTVYKSGTCDLKEQYPTRFHLKEPVSSLAWEKIILKVIQPIIPFQVKPIYHHTAHYSTNQTSFPQISTTPPHCKGNFYSKLPWTFFKEFYFSNGTFMENFLFSYNWLRQNGLFNSGGWYGLSWLEILVGSCVSRSVLLVKSSVQGLCVP